uniref:Uncharacterized protein n=2 Tax=Lactuca sativa TaxID=4236 RepID=A0A9R1X3K9_LACSA|nr:hypothetical protein LSAT_V11C700344140 [Lactuca sativa]
MHKFMKTQMADKEEGHATAPKGADWEVVSLTASAYAAAPGGNIPELKHEEKGEVVDKDKVETSNALFMSTHFVLPPKQDTEIFDQLDDSESVKEKEIYDLKKLTELHDYNKIPFSNDQKLALGDTDFTENTTFSSLNMGAKEQSIYTSPALDSLHSEATMGLKNIDDEMRELDESVYSSEEPKENNNHHEHDGSGCGVPYGVWLKKQAVSLYAHTKETSTFWSIFAAAAVMGIVIIGQQWQHERWQVLRHELKFRIHDERMRMMTGLKDAIIGGNRRDFLVNGSISRDR